VKTIINRAAAPRRASRALAADVIVLDREDLVARGPDIPHYRRPLRIRSFGDQVLKRVADAKRQGSRHAAAILEASPRKFP